MFTGIIEEVGFVLSAEEVEGGRRIRFQAKLAPELRLGQSISVNGACLSVAATSAECFDVVAVEETLRKTTLNLLRSGMPVNMERALRVGVRLDGHFLQGHVDATCPIVEVKDRLYSLKIGAFLARYVVPVGSIALDGISLTVARLEGPMVTVSIIPHTFDHTIAKTWRVGTRVNVESDVLGKYVVGHLERGRPRLDASR